MLRNLKWRKKYFTNFCIYILVKIFDKNVSQCFMTLLKSNNCCFKVICYLYNNFKSDCAEVFKFQKNKIYPNNSKIVSTIDFTVSGVTPISCTRWRKPLSYSIRNYSFTIEFSIWKKITLSPLQYFFVSISNNFRNILSSLMKNLLFYTNGNFFLEISNFFV